MKRSSLLSLTLSIAGALFTQAAVSQRAAFDVATVRPSAADVKFEHDGATDFLPDGLRMHDVTVDACIRLAYGVQNSQILGPNWLDSDHFDIVTKTEHPATRDQMKLMLRTLLADRFGLAFHHETREMRALVLSVAAKGAKLKPAADPAAPPYRQNSANGTVARSMPIQEFADFLSQPLHMPIVDQTGLTGKYDFVLDFTAYLPERGKNMDVGKPDANYIVKSAMEDELGLKLDTRKTTVQVMVIDHIAQPSAN
jgi:uncharacterized protein (TIGR03435 family)